MSELRQEDLYTNAVEIINQEPQLKSLLRMMDTDPERMAATDPRRQYVIMAALAFKAGQQSMREK